MKIVVTGALGHIGSSLIRDLSLAFPDCHIVMLDNLSTQRYCALFDLPEQGRYSFFQKDICKENIAEIVQDADAVIHLAAITNAAASFDMQEEVERNNYEGTKIIAELCANYGIPLIALSSTSVYGTQNQLVDENCSENDLNPQSPYAWSKLREEKLLKQMGEEKGLRFIVFRFGTIFGVSEGMRFHTAINKFCWQAVMQQPLTVWTTALYQYRPYLSLIDAVRALIFSLQHQIFDNEIYNVLTTNSTVHSIIEIIKKVIPDVQVIFQDSPIMNQLSYEVCNQKFLRHGFEYVGDLSRGIHQTLHMLKQANLGAHHERNFASGWTGN
jgi:UDP-glucose 4-epimerase